MDDFTEMHFTTIKIKENLRRTRPGCYTRTNELSEKISK